MRQKTFAQKAYIENADFSDDPGEHWVAETSETIEFYIYFDSYGITQDEDYILPNCIWMDSEHRNITRSME